MNHGTDPNDNIPILIVKEGSDKDALRPPKNFQLIHHEKARRKSFGLRHNCADKKDKTKPGYWSCRLTKFFGRNISGWW